MNWGYLYNEFKITAYFWEFIKMSIRVLIIVILTFYEDYYVIKGILIYFVLLIFGALSERYMPYHEKKLN